MLNCFDNVVDIFMFAIFISNCIVQIGAIQPVFAAI